MRSASISFKMAMGATASLFILLGGVTWAFQEIGKGEMVKPSTSAVHTEKVSIVTNEIKWTSPDGKKEIEAYRWDPGTIVVHQDETVALEFYGIKGESHPFKIEGYNLSGKVERGKVETVTFVADKPGNFQIVCLTHPDMKHNGPMIANLVVLPKR